MSERPPITRNEAVRLWSKVEPKIRGTIRNTLSTMGLRNAMLAAQAYANSTEGGDPGQAPEPQEDTSTKLTLPSEAIRPRQRVAVPGAGAVRKAMIDDKEFREEIFSKVAEEFWTMVERRTMPAGAKPAYAHMIAVRATWRLASNYARELFVHALARPANRDDANDSTAACPAAWDRREPEIPHFEELLDLKRNLQRVLPLLRTLDPLDQQALLAKYHVPGAPDYADLAVQYGVKEGALRVRAHRALKTLRTRLGLPTESGANKDAA